MSSKTENQATTKDVYQRLRPYVIPYRMRLVVGILCGLLQGVTTFGLIIVVAVGLGIVSGEEIQVTGLPNLPSPDEIEGNAGGVSLRRIVLTVSVLPVIALFQGLMFFCGKYLVEWVGHRVVTDLRARLFTHIHTLPMQFFSRNRVGELISRITNDTTLLTNLVSNVVGDMIREPFTLIACVVGMFALDWKLSLMVLVVFPAIVIPVAVLGKKVRKASRKGQKGLGDMLSVVQESIGGALVVKAFQTEDDEISRFNIFNSKVFRMHVRQSVARSLNEPIMILLSAIGMAGVVIYAFVYDLPLALLVAFALALGQMYKPVKKLSQIHMRVQRAAPGVERIFEVLDEANTITDRPDAKPFEGRVDTIEFRDVSFAYDEKKILDEINLKVECGQCIAFVGSSGAGKTTLVNLIPRFFDVTTGQIEINGRDICGYTLQSLRAQIGVVTQQTVLFNRSVAENIAYGSPQATQEQIVDAAKRANAHPFITELDHGYDTVIGERGSLLSGGMAQRVAIARALLKNPPILILDEATSALDTESERLVQGALDELMKDRTVFVIAHRLSTIAHADSIVVLDKGRIIEQGTHAELLDQGGKYKYLYDIQFSNAG